MLLAVVCASKDVFSCYSYVEKKRHCLHTKYKILSLCPNVASSALLVPNQNQFSDFDEKKIFSSAAVSCNLPHRLSEPFEKAFEAAAKI